MRIKLLLIDDDCVSLMITKKYLIGSGITEIVEDLIQFSSANEALEFLTLSKNSPEQYIFWVLLDINMPIINGWEFLKLAKSNKLESNLKVVMLTSSISEDDRIKADSFETVYGFFSKPMDQEKCDEFKALIHRVKKLK